MAVDTESGDEAFATVGPTDANLDGVRSIVLDDGELILYDEAGEDEWIQTDEYVDASLML